MSSSPPARRIIVAVYNASGTKIGTYTYDAWGNCTTSTTSESTTAEKRVVKNYNPFRYRGYFYDYELGLYYLQSRYYNPATGRFINADGYVNANGDLIGYNMYTYCSNNPVMFVDPTGRFWSEFFVFLSDRLTEIQNVFAAFMDGINHFLETFCDSFVVNIGFGTGLGLGVETGGFEGEALVRSDFITLKKDAEEYSLFYYGRAEEQYLSVEGMGSVVESGKNYFIHANGFEENIPVLPHFNTTLSFGAKVYFGLGATVSVGFDWNYFLSTLFSKN